MRSIFLFIGCLAGLCTDAQVKLPKVNLLFNGRNLQNWIVKIKDHPLNDNFGNTFRVEDGLMKVRYDQYDSFREQYGHIFYGKKLTAYLLVVEYRFVGQQAPGGAGWALRNSGVMLQGQDPETMDLHQDFPISLEEQLLGGNGKDERSNANLCTPGTNVLLNGTLYTQHCVNSSAATFHGDQWVHVEALVLGDSVIKHIVNRDTVLVYSKPQYDGRDKWVKQLGLRDGQLISAGYFSLQSESHPVDFRKVELYDLEPYLGNPKKLKQVIAALQKRKQ